MGGKKRRDIMIFNCDIPGCGARHTERCAGKAARLCRRATPQARFSWAHADAVELAP